MTIELVDEVSISGHYLSALINNDMSGLSDSEITEINDFDSAYPMATYDISDELSFQRCTICGLMADCYDVGIYQ